MISKRDEYRENVKKNTLKVAHRAADAFQSAANSSKGLADAVQSAAKSSKDLADAVQSAENSSKGLADAVQSATNSSKGLVSAAPGYFIAKPREGKSRTGTAHTAGPKPVSKAAI